MHQRAREDNLTICYSKKHIGVSFPRVWEWITTLTTLRQYSADALGCRGSTASLLSSSPFSRWRTTRRTDHIFKTRLIFSHYNTAWKHHQLHCGKLSSARWHKIKFYIFTSAFSQPAPRLNFVQGFQTYSVVVCEGVASLIFTKLYINTAEKIKLKNNVWCYSLRHAVKILSRSLNLSVLNNNCKTKKTVSISSFTVVVLVSSVALGKEPRTTTELTAPKPFLGYIPLTKEPATFSEI